MVTPGLHGVAKGRARRQVTVPPKTEADLRRIGEHLDPREAAVRGHDGQRRWLGDDRRIGTHASFNQRARARARELFVDHPGDDNLSRRALVGGAQPAARDGERAAESQNGLEDRDADGVVDQKDRMETDEEKAGKKENSAPPREPAPAEAP